MGDAASEAAVSAPVELGPTEPTARLPMWIRTRPPSGDRYPQVRSILAEMKLGTVCREARCPNLPECWSAGTATLMLLGTDCTRRCSFCAVRTHWPNGHLDRSEPERVAEAVARWGLRYVVLTQVCRDDLADGGAAMLSETVRALRGRTPSTKIELLVGDLGGARASLETVVKARPDVLAHNIETVERISPEVRDRRASYAGSLALLRQAGEGGPARSVTKSSVMLGLGETESELYATMSDLRSAGVELLTLGQYLRPSLSHRPVARYVTPEEFARYGGEAERLGFAGVEAGPLVRSSYHAQELFEAALGLRGR
ncbi:MAG TPA: lipoyl synthase [Thermoplasmata archaeon]|nr:lipoyl synthase [Thermoplasmata archaeon]